MNSSKANNGWTLNPSKSFPGKFYYFNVHNGESVWTTDPEKTISKDSNIHKISDRNYFPREPSTPPPDFPSTSSTVAHRMNQSTFIRQPETQRVINNTLNKYPTPSFGKAAFPNYMSDVELYMPNIIWAPVPLPTVPSMCKIDSRQYLSMSSQTDLIDKVRVDTCGTSLSDRFAVYKSPFNRQVQKKYETSTPVKFKNEGSTSQSFFNTFQGANESSIPNTSLQSIFKRVRPKSEADKETNLFGSKKLYGLNFNELIPVHRSYEDFRTKSVLKEPFKRCCTATAGNKETLDDFESNRMASIDTNVIQRRQPYQLDQENDETVKFDDVTKEKDIVKLGDNDLRLLLIAKRRKSVGLEDMHIGSKKIKTFKEEDATKQSKSQKRVSFNLQLADSDSADDHNEVQLQTNEDPVEQLDLPKDLWYVMVDPETLVDDYQLIEEYVLSDKSCRLLLPCCLRAAIEAMGMGDCRDRRRVIVARQSARRLAQPHAYMVTLPEVDISGNTSEMSDVLKYCLKINNLGYLVVFLTSSAKLLTDAKSLKITCLNTKEIKLNLKKAPEITFDLKKVQISVTNDGCGENLKSNALPSSEFKPYVSSNRDPNPEIVSDKNLFENSSKNINDKIRKVDANTSPVGSDKLIDITKTNLNNNNVITYKEEATDIDKDIQNLFLNELVSKEILNEVELTLGSKVNNEKEKNCFEFKKPNPFDKKKVEKEYGSKRFDVKSDLMEKTIRTRLDEWLCSLSQIVEDALTQVLMRHTRFSDNTIRPWVLYDVVDHVKKLYDSHTEVRSMADKFTSMLLQQCSQIGYLKLTMPPTVFMDLFECAYLLIQALKRIQPTYLELSDAEHLLNNLLSEIEKPTNIILPIAPPVTTPDIVIESIKQNFVRHPSDIIDYVKKHFENWKNYEPSQDEENISKRQNENNICGDYKIVRTCGRNLNLLNIDGKSLTVTNPTETVQKYNTGNTKEDNVTSTNNLLEDLNLSNSETWVDEASNNGNILTSEETTNAMNIVSESTKQEIHLKQSVATPLENENKNDENIETSPQIQDFETKLIKERETIDLDALDYSELKNSINSKTPSPIPKNDSDMSMTDAVSFVYEIKNTKRTNKINYFNENNNYVSTNRSYFQENNNNTRESNVRVTNDVSIDSLDIMSVKDDSINDSGIENDSVHAHSLVRVFLVELSQSFKTVHMFINKCVKDFRADRVREEQKLRMHAKANYLFITVADIISELKKIIQRESNDATAVQAMLLRAGLQATEDKRITRYKQVVTKCLEQAITLENALKLILSMTGDDYDGSISTCTLDSNIRYFNLFG